MHERDILLATLEKVQPEERAAYLTQACGEDAQLRSRVEALLRATEVHDRFLERPAVETEVLDRQTDGVRQQGADDDELSLDFLQPADDLCALGRLGPYTITNVVGRGGMGVVLKAQDAKLNRVVAIKVLAPELAANPTAKKRFLREARAAASVVHQHVVTIHAVDEDRLPYLVMEYIDGQSLQEKIDREGHLELKEILRIGQQVAAGLAAAHAHGLMHRDVKPANILLENGVERVRITDFGLARAVDDVGITRTGEVAGTPQYMSPEQAQGLPMDARSDLFSLGCVLYAMCTGRSPFRAETTLATVRRVCDDTPRPIREVNPEVPLWLVEITDRLLAKQPAERFQSAAEVAELLSRHLAEVQHPSAVTPVVVTGAPTKWVGVTSPDAGKLAARSTGHITRSVMATRGWAIPAAALVCLLIALGLTEATGTTQLAATVVRIFTPSGTLIVETDDPAVKVTIEGDGGLVITGAGPHEVRLKPGSYKLQADKNGQPVPLERELVSIAKGGREVVRVKLETPPAPAVAKGEQGAFVLLAAGKVRKFATLAAAVVAASDGDTIEIRGNGPFVSVPINCGKTPLTIRAGAGFRPVIQLSPEAIEQNVPLLETSAALVLEGLELQRASAGPEKRIAVNGADAPLHAANCRFLAPVWTARAPACVFLNCEFLTAAYGFGARIQSSSTLRFENCLHRTKGFPIGFGFEDGALIGTSLQIKRNTFATGAMAIAWMRKGRLSGFANPEQNSRAVTTDASECIFDVGSALGVEERKEFRDKAGVVEPGEGELALQRLIQWRGERNVFVAGSTSLVWPVDWQPQPPHGPKSLDEWKRFWNATESQSREVRVRYQGGDLLGRTDLDQLTPDDFRLRAGSAGYRASPDGKDLGADIDLVGPGSAYERWKKTPEYQQWLKDTGQLRETAAAKPETGAFVVQGGKGVAERKFDTLAEAVQAASDGDIIEVRGNGPFITQPISINDRALVIRAGAGFWPVIQADPDEPASNLLQSNSRLVLEGLDLRWVEARPFDPSDPRYRHLVFAGEPTARLDAVNCRFLMNRRAGPHKMSCIWAALPRLRNCQIVVGGHGTLDNVFDIFDIVGKPNTTVMVDNCLTIGWGLTPHLTHAEPTQVVLNHNTVLGPHFVTLCLVKMIDPPAGEQDSKPLQIAASGNILAGRMTFRQVPELLEQGKILSAQDAERLLPQVVGWQDDQNLYSSPADSDLLGLFVNPIPSPTRIATLPAWKNFWGLEELDSQRGLARFQGGDLVARAMSKPELIVPEDFRLRPDSPGYRAGPDGKDLGADVDLVGPGPAYDRWKKTPEYQQWLKDTGQLRETAAAKPETGAFVVQGGKGVAERKFDTLAEAVQGASDGGTIEIRGNGPFVSEPIRIQHALTIRAGEGFRPVIKLRPEKAVESKQALIATNSSLVLECLEFHRAPPPGSSDGFVVEIKEATLRAANCRFRGGSVYADQSPACVLRNCEFLADESWGGVTGRLCSGAKMIVENCLILRRVGAGLGGMYDDATTGDVSIQITRSTLASKFAPLWFAHRCPLPAGVDGAQARKPIRFEVPRTIFLGSSIILCFERNKELLNTAGALKPADVYATLLRLLQWQGEHNLFATGTASVSWNDNNERQPPHGPKSLEEWRRFWGTAEADSLEGRVRFQGANLLGRTEADLDRLTPEDFRLLPDSPGYRAGPDGKDLGADVDLVGPGPAYERWKKTPEYQQWLSEIRQVSK